MKNQLLALISANQERGKALTVKNEGDITHVYMYDAIGGYFGIDPQNFVTRLNDIESPEIKLHINSPGGDVFDARAIATAIKQHKSKITAQIDGLCASAATYISAACESVSMADGGFYMIHEGWTLAIGNKNDLTKMVDLLNKVDAAIVNDYERKTGKDRDQIESWMAEETWFSAEEALENGFIDQLIEEDAVENTAKWDLSAYSNAPKNMKNSKPSDDEFEKELMARRRRQAEAIAMAAV